MSETIRLFVGYDRAETVAWHVLAHSVHERASGPVSITPVMLSQLTRDYTRPRDPLAATEFSLSRFLVPYLCGFDGWAIFADCDMLCRADLAELWSLRDPRFAVQVVQHDHVPTSAVKFNGHQQTRYEKKNWSSVMLFNCSQCIALTPDYVGRASGLQLHQFKWLGADERIGALPSAWNHLVGYRPYREDAKLVHFTEGGPYFRDYAMCDYADEWRSARARMLSVHERETVAPRPPLAGTDAAVVRTPPPTH